MSNFQRSPSPRIAVIGAGCSGLAALKVLAENGPTNLTCFEKNGQIGGNWVYTAGEGHSSVCDPPHIISSKWLSRFSDFPMPEEFDYLLIANGHHAVPRHPAWAADFKGQYFHSHQFKNNRGLEGKRVLRKRIFEKPTPCAGGSFSSLPPKVEEIGNRLNPKVV